MIIVIARQQQIARQTFQFLSLTKNIVIQQLNIIARRNYLIFLNNKNVNNLIRLVFLEVKFNHDVYILLRKRCSKFYK